MFEENPFTQPKNASLVHRMCGTRVWWGPRRKRCTVPRSCLRPHHPFLASLPRAPLPAYPEGPRALGAPHRRALVTRACAAQLFLVILEGNEAIPF